MKTKFGFSCFLTLLLLLPASFTGCKTVDGERVPDTERIARVVREASEIGTREVLLRRPEWNTNFQIAHSELVHLSQADNISIDQILDIMNRLPINELRSDDARLAVSGAKLIISAIDVPAIDAERLEQLRPIVVSMAQGVQSGMIPPDPAIPR